MSSLNLLTPPTTPDECSAPQFPYDIELITFDGPQDRYGAIELRGKKTREGIRVKVSDVIAFFKLNIAYMETVGPFLVMYSLQDLYTQDFYSISGASNAHTFSKYAKSYELYIKYKGIEILAYNVPELTPFRDWLESVMVDDLQCYEEIDYDSLGW